MLYSRARHPHKRSVNDDRLDEMRDGACIDQVCPSCSIIRLHYIFQSVSGGGLVRVRCVSARGRDAVFGCGFGLSAGTRICGGGPSVKNGMSIPASLSSSSNSTYVVVSARDQTRNRPLPSCIGFNDTNWL